MGLADLYRAIRACFPELADKADAQHQRLCGSLDAEDPFLWFESLAKALNSEMDAEVDATKYLPLLQMLGNAIDTGTEELIGCIDVGFMENLFWQVASKKAQPYWDLTPDRLKRFYVAFFGYSPVL